jgi:hypothetical protein
MTMHLMVILRGTFPPAEIGAAEATAALVLLGDGRTTRRGTTAPERSACSAGLTGGAYLIDLSADV